MDKVDLILSLESAITELKGQISAIEGRLVALKEEILNEPEPAPVPEPAAEPEVTVDEGPADFSDMDEDIMEDLPAAGPEEEAEKEAEPVEDNEPIAISAERQSPARYQWQKDLPGLPVKDIRSAIALNDRVLFINSLFGQDPILFQNTLSALNASASTEEAEEYVSAHFPQWDLSSEVVYRFMMAVRRKLR